MKKYIVFGFLALMANLWAVPSHAIQVGIDTFSIQQDSTVLLNDTFSDGVPPPSGPNGPTTYNVNGTIPSNAESGGLLQIDSANGIHSANAGGDARIATNVTPRGTSSELSSGTLLLTGVFSLITPAGPLNNGYGIRFIDNPAGAGPGNNQEVLELNVQYWTGNASNPAGLYIRYLLQDFNLDTITTLDAVPIVAPSGDEVCLSLSRPDATNSNFFASYAYGTGGICGAAVQLSTPGVGFKYEDFVRGQFHVFETAVPEPGSWMLTGLGLLGIRLIRRWKGKP